MDNVLIFTKIETPKLEFCWDSDVDNFYEINQEDVYRVLYLISISNNNRTATFRVNNG